MQRKSELTFLNSVINYETENFSVILFSAITTVRDFWPRIRRVIWIWPTFLWIRLFWVAFFCKNIPENSFRSVFHGSLQLRKCKKMGSGQHLVSSALKCHVFFVIIMVLGVALSRHLSSLRKKTPQVVFVQEKRRRGDEIIGPYTKKVLLDLYADFFSGLAFRETKVLWMSAEHSVVIGKNLGHFSFKNLRKIVLNSKYWNFG